MCLRTRIYNYNFYTKNNLSPSDYRRHMSTD